MRVQRSDNFPAIIALIIAAIVVCAGVISVMRLRFETGNMFPPYSSYRSETDGTKALYESLAKLPDVRVERYVNAVGQKEEMPETTMLRLGLTDPIFTVSEDMISLHGGGRMVIAFLPGAFENFWFQPSTNTTTSTTNQAENASNEVASVSNTVNVSTNKLTQGEQEALEGIAALQERDEWQRFYAPLGLTMESHKGESNFVDVVRAADADPALPETIRLKDPFVFIPDTNLNHKVWRTLYTLNDQPVVMERSEGEGSVLVVGSSYPFSNKALRHDRATAFLAYVIGSPKTVYFDETHLGIAAHQGIATLIREYNLETVIAVFLLLAILYIWKATSRPVPAYAFGGWSRHQLRQEGRDSLSGLETLMGRYTRPEELLKRLVLTYRDSRAGMEPLDDEVRAEVRRQVAESEHHSSEEKDVEAYKAICRIIKNKGAGHGP